MNQNAKTRTDDIADKLQAVVNVPADTGVDLAVMLFGTIPAPIVPLFVRPDGPAMREPRTGALLCLMNDPRFPQFKNWFAVLHRQIYPKQPFGWCLYRPATLREIDMVEAQLAQLGKTPGSQA